MQEITLSGPRGLRLTNAYLGGLIDGEGSLGLYKSKTSYRPRLAVSMIGKREHALLSLIAQLYGGRFYTYRRSTGQVVHTWEVAALRDLRSVLYTVLPHLMLKRDQASILYYWCNLPSTRRKEEAPSVSAQLKHIKANTKGRLIGAIGESHGMVESCS